MADDDWALVVGTIYEVNRTGGIRTIDGTTFAIEIDCHGYPGTVYETPEGNRRHRIHRMVATTFLGPLPPGQVTRHLDDDKLNYRLDNLQYGTKSQNMNDAVANGKHHCIPIKRRLGKARYAELQRRVLTEKAAPLALEFGVPYWYVYKLSRSFDGRRLSAQGATPATPRSSPPPPGRT